MKIVAIVLSAGKGTRMNSEIPKQYLTISEKPVLSYCLDAFEKSKVDEIIIVTGEGDEDYVSNEIVKRYGYSKVTKIVAGGTYRFNSVYNGLKECDDADYCLIHDGARPCITSENINHLIEEVMQKKAVVAASPVKDTIKIVNDDLSVKSTPERATLFAVQTPQVFEYGLVREAYDCLISANDISVTDDAMVVEKYSSAKVYLIDTGYDNIKITTPGDLDIAKGILDKQ